MTKANLTAGASWAEIFLQSQGAVAHVQVVSARGSTPREQGAWMLVSGTALAGTIGGGQLEVQSIAAARALLADGGSEASLDVPLGPEISQCCGGRVTISIRRVDGGMRDKIRSDLDREVAAYPSVIIFGAGHVGRALAAALGLLPVRTLVIDSRTHELGLLDPSVDRQLCVLPEVAVKAAPAGAAFVITTHEHRLDFLIAAEALGRGDAAYVGMIGSATKRKSFENWCRRSGEVEFDPARLICPIGGGCPDDKRPQVIAAFVATEIMKYFNTAKQFAVNEATIGSPADMKRMGDRPYAR